MSSDALFHRDGDYFVPTDRTNSPWSPTLLHGGSIAGLLAYGLEQHAPDEGMRFIRVTNDLFRPAPKVPVKLETQFLREGGRIGVIECRLMADGKEVARATGLRAKVQNIELPEHALSKIEPPARPDGIPITGFLGEKLAPDIYVPGLNYAVDMKLVSGFQFKGEGRAWLRIKSRLIADQDNTPFVYLGMLSDFGNGLGQAYIGGNNACINADIGASIYRYPVSEWIYLDSKTQVQAQGFGTTETLFIDEQGAVGRVTQSLVVKPFGY